MSCRTVRAAALAACSLAAAVLSGAALAVDALEELFRSPPSSIAGLDSVAALDEAQQQLTQGNWRVYSSAPPQLPEVRGRTPKDDVDQWLMNEPHALRLAALRAQIVSATAAHQDAALRRALSEAAVLLEQERDRLYLVWAYWAQQPRVAAHAARFADLAARLPEADVASGRGSIEAALKEAGGRYEAALAAAEGGIAQQDVARTAMEAALQQLLNTYNAERGKLGAELSRTERQAGHAAPFRMREAPCSAPITETSATDRPALMPGAASSGSFYPTHSRAMSFEGVIILEAEVAASGCIEKVSVYESSGLPELDQAAIDWTLASGTMRPAQRDHQAVAATLRYRMNFRLHD